MKVQSNFIIYLLTVQAAVSTLGLLTASIPAVQWAHLHSRDLQQAILQIWSYGESLDKQIRILSLVKRKLWWWKSQTKQI